MKAEFFLQKYKKFLSLRLERSILKCGEKIFCRDTGNYFKFEAGKFHFETLGERFLKKYRKSFGLWAEKFLLKMLGELRF